MPRPPIQFPEPSRDELFSFTLRIGGQVVRLDIEATDLSEELAGEVVEMPKKP
jgi:hypothetical protein